LSVRTRPVAQFQPVPSLSTSGTAKLELTIGEDGSVRDINVRQSVPGMPQVIREVQRWRFKPATENGKPVSASYTVDIAFNGH
ncbi:MAG TPA: TonB family protein, partial [Thermoanaerobaculia bacterium]